MEGTGGATKRIECAHRVFPRVPTRVQDLLVVVNVLGIDDRLAVLPPFAARAPRASSPGGALAVLAANLLGLERRLVRLEDNVLSRVRVVDVEVVVVRAGEDVPARRRGKDVLDQPLPNAKNEDRGMARGARLTCRRRKRCTQTCQRCSRSRTGRTACSGGDRAR